MSGLHVEEFNLIELLYDVSANFLSKINDFCSSSEFLYYLDQDPDTFDPNEFLEKCYKNNEFLRRNVK